MKFKLPNLVGKFIVGVHYVSSFSSRLFSLPKNLSQFGVATKPLFAFLILATTTGISIPAVYLVHHAHTQTPNTISHADSHAVLGANTTSNPFQLNGTIEFNIPAVFNQDVTFKNGLTLDGQNIDLGKGKITASNILYGLTSGTGLSVTAGQNPTITNTGVTSLQTKTGDLTLTAGSGISLSGLQISNSDAGSSQKIFGSVAVGTTTLTAGNNTDTLTFSAGSGITLALDTANKKLTITGTGGSTTIDLTSQVTGILPVPNGGTGLSTVSVGSLLYGNGTSALNSLGIGANNAILTSNGSTPSWTTNLPVASGGTGDTTFTPNGVLYGNGTSGIQVTAAGTSGQVLSANSSGTPTWSTLAISAGSGCSNCIASNPASLQIIQPTGNITGLTIEQTATASPTADIFNVTNSTGTTKYLQIDSSGNVIINNTDLQLGGTISMKTDDTNLANANDTFVYNPSSDADGGAWTNNGNAQASSWYNETINNTGANCVLGTDTRCGIREFPKRATILATNTHLYIYDASNNTLWMTFNLGTGFAFSGTPKLNAIYALNGIVYIATSTNGLIAIDFINDRILEYNYNAGNGGVATFLGTISNRNSNKGYGAVSAWGQIASDTVNGVFTRVINGKTYVAASTLGGVSVIDVTDQTINRYIDN